AQEGRALVNGIGQSNIAALEIGNEADLYPQFGWYVDRNGTTYFGRPPSWGVSNFIDEFTRWRHALPAVPVAGPAFADPIWMASLPSFLSAEPGLAYLTYHRYPLRSCIHNPLDPMYPSIPNLLADSASAGLAASVQPYAQEAHAA